jgi:hypothetical protein
MSILETQEVSARGGEEITASEQPGADMLSGIEGPLPCDVHEMTGAGAAQPDNAGFGKRGPEPPQPPLPSRAT